MCSSTALTKTGGGRNNLCVNNLQRVRQYYLIFANNKGRNLFSKMFVMFMTQSTIYLRLKSSIFLKLDIIQLFTSIHTHALL